MRALAFILALVAATPAVQADGKPPPKRARKLLVLEGVDVPGQPPKPGVVVVLPRRVEARRAVDGAGAEHLQDAAARRSPGQP